MPSILAIDGGATKFFLDFRVDCRDRERGTPG